jgi:hypothetical protein
MRAMIPCNQWKNCKPQNQDLFGYNPNKSGYPNIGNTHAQQEKQPGVMKVPSRFIKYLVLTYRSTPASSRPGSIYSSTSRCEGTALGPEDVGATDGVSAKVTLLRAPADEDAPAVLTVSI